jgi:ABC-type transport system involved in multi-copper enzyme maturation permease subunit
MQQESAQPCPSEHAPVGRELAARGHLAGVRFNPCVAERELRTLLRGWRPFALMLAQVLVLSAVFLFVLWQQSARGPNWGTFVTLTGAARANAASGLAAYGRSAFVALILFQLGLLCLGLPAYSATIITMEREKRTLEALCVTPLTANDIVSGKCLPVIALGLILSLVSLPLGALCICLGGVSPVEAGWCYSYLMANAAWLAVLGVAISAVFRRTSAALAVTYAAVGALVGSGLFGEATDAAFSGVWHIGLGFEWAVIWVLLGFVIASVWIALVPFIESAARRDLYRMAKAALPMLGAAALLVAAVVALESRRTPLIPLHLMGPAVPMMWIVHRGPNPTGFPAWLIATVSLLLLSLLLWRLTVAAFHVRPAAR